MMMPPFALAVNDACDGNDDLLSLISCVCVFGLAIEGMYACGYVMARMFVLRR